MSQKLRSTLSDEEAITWYRSPYPLREWNNRQEPGKAITSYCDDYWERGMYWIEDYPRHTEISAYCNLTNGALDQAASRYGNSREIIRIHYRDFMTLAEAVLHYQLMPTALKGKHDWTKNPMADWSHCTLENLKPEVRAEVEQKRVLFSTFDSNKNYEQRDCEELRIKRCREAWANSKPETLKKLREGQKNYWKTRRAQVKEHGLPKNVDPHWASLTQEQKDHRMAGVRKWHEERRALKAQQTPKPVNPTWAAMPDEKKQNAPEIFRIGREHQKDERQARLAAKTEAEAAGAAAEAQAMSGHTPDQFRPASTQAAAANESATTSVPVSQVTATPIDAAA